MTEMSPGVLCPSARSDMRDARIVGMIAGEPETPRIAYLAPGVVVPDAALTALGALEPAEVFRFAAGCEEHRCAHFAAGQCSLAERVVRQLPEVVELVPRCQIRAACRWFAEQGAAACRRCPQVVTLIPPGDSPLHRAASPPVFPSQLPPDMSPEAHLSGSVAPPA